MIFFNVLSYDALLISFNKLLSRFVFNSPVLLNTMSFITNYFIGNWWLLGVISIGLFWFSRNSKCNQLFKGMFKEEYQRHGLHIIIPVLILSLMDFYALNKFKMALSIIWITMFVMNLLFKLFGRKGWRIQIRY